MLNVNAADLHWDAKGKTASVEASQIRVLGDARYFNAYNTKTNVAVTFVLRTNVRSQDGELLYWEYSPSEDSCLRHPQMRGWKLIVFND